MVLLSLCMRALMHERAIFKVLNRAVVVSALIRVVMQYGIADALLKAA